MNSRNAEIVMKTVLASGRVGVSSSREGLLGTVDGERNAERRDEEIMIYLNRSANWRPDGWLAGGHMIDSSDCNTELTRTWLAQERYKWLQRHLCQKNGDIHDRVRRPRRGPIGGGRLKNPRQYETLEEFQASNLAQILEQRSVVSRTGQARKGITSEIVLERTFWF
jgi:hypothetical protein